MRQIKHPLSGSIYEYADDGQGPVLVTKGTSQGRFTKDGVWVGGAIRSADPELCRWIASGGPDRDGALGASRRFVSTNPEDADLDMSDPAEAVPGGA